MIDVIILSSGKQDTQNTIDSLGIPANIIVASRNTDYKAYNKVNTYLVIKEKFNYNRFVNQALEFTKHDWVLISNDDVEYTPGWFDAMQDAIEKTDADSLSPMDPRLHERYYNDTFHSEEDCVEGYATTRHVSGWSILVKRDVLNTILPLDEKFDMYYQDNDYAEVIKRAGIKHVLVKKAIAYHKGTERVEDVYSTEKIEKLKQDELKFRSKWQIWT